MFLHSEHNRFSLNIDLLIALCPVLAWSIYLFGSRAAVIILISGFSSLLFDIPSNLLLHHKTGVYLFSPTAFFSGILASFLVPVSVPLWIPVLLGIFVAISRAGIFYFGHRLLNSSIFSCFMVHLLFPELLSKYTEPFAYFSPFQITIKDSLIQAYRVFSPLQLLCDGKIYEDGSAAQIYGYIAGPIGAVASLCLIFSFVWLIYRKHASLYASISYLLTLIVLLAAFSPSDLEMLDYVIYSIFSGAIVFSFTFAMNDFSSVPCKSYHLSRIIFGVIAGLLTFLFRTAKIGIIGDLSAILISNLATPWLEKLEYQLFFTPKSKKSKLHQGENNEK